MINIIDYEMLNRLIPIIILFSVLLLTVLLLPYIRYIIYRKGRIIKEGDLSYLILVQIYQIWKYKNADNMSDDEAIKLYPYAIVESDRYVVNINKKPFPPIDNLRLYYDLDGEEFKVREVCE